MIYQIGKNALDNWRIWKDASPTATIFHLDSFSSPYVITDKGVDELEKEEILFLAKECLAHSKYKNMYNIKVLYTAKLNTVLGENPGSFIIKSNKKKYIICLYLRI